MARATWQPDKWERLALVAQCVGPASTVVDVGGRGRELARFLPGARVLTANIEPPADLIVDARVLPFGDRSFDVVTSCDVLEHMPSESRAPHLAELIRVAGRRLVLCCPFGTPQKDAAERRVADLIMRDVGMKLDYLEEHLAYGFPREDEVIAMVGDAGRGARVTCFYQGDYERGDALLLDGVRARWGHNPKALVRFVRDAYLRPRRPTLDRSPAPTTTRLFVVADVEP